MMRFMVCSLEFIFDRPVIRFIGIRLNIVELRLKLVDLFLDTRKPISYCDCPLKNPPNQITSPTTKIKGRLGKIEKIPPNSQSRESGLRVIFL